MKNILDGGVREVYPVTLSEQVVLGRAAYTSVSMIPGHIDLVVIAVRADVVGSILHECADKGAKAAIVISAGFKEVGEAGRKMEEEIAYIAQERGIVLLGPNCLGVIDAHADWNASFAVAKPRPGHIAFVSQSGALGTALLDWANREGVGFSKFVSLGNEASLSELEFLEYLADDDDTKAILLYLEQVSDGGRFLEAARRVTGKKPLVVLRAGRSARGAVAVASHTGSLAPGDAIFGAALRQVGAVSVDSLRTLFSLAKLFEMGHSTPLRNIVILTNGGGPSVNTADLIEDTDTLSLVSFRDPTLHSLRSVLPSMAAVNNPIDVIGDAGPERYDKALRTLTELKEVDAIITLVTPQMMTDPAGIAHVLTKHKDNKPLMPVFMGGDTVEPGIVVLKESGMVNFESPTDVVEALDALARTTASIEVAQKHPPTERPGRALEMYPFEETRSILQSYDLHLEGAYITNKSDVAVALKKLGPGPYAMKAVAQELVHKSDLNAVRLNIDTHDEVVKTWDEIVSEVKKKTGVKTVDGMLIQKMVAGVECIIGMKRDPVFGPVIVFGLGGIYVEILKDSSLRIAPVSKAEALRQIREIQGISLLTGARGSEPVHLEAIAQAIEALSHLAIDYPDIQEVDFNPVFATPQGVHLVDVRFMRYT